MTTADDFTAALAANPADASTRLVYADFLDEHDEPVEAALQRVLAGPDEDRYRLEYAGACERAAGTHTWVWHPLHARAVFVREQLEEAAIERGRPATDCKLTPGLQLRALRLPAAGRYKFVFVTHEEYERRERLLETTAAAARLHAETWFVRRARFREPTAWTWVRGFVERVQCTTADWLAAGREVCERSPVRKAVLTTYPECEISGSSIRIVGTATWFLREGFWSPAVQKVHGKEKTVREMLGELFPGVEFEVRVPS